MQTWLHLAGGRRRRRRSKTDVRWS